jgi:hypothetical protein
MDYITKHIQTKDLTDEIRGFIVDASFELGNRYGNKFNWTSFDLDRFAEYGLLLLCYKDGVPTGFMMATLFTSFFDDETKILMQQVLYAKPNTRACHYLMQHFIDFGKRYANHTITMIGSETNIKARSLERLGFTKLEELYRLES